MDWQGSAEFDRHPMLGDFRFRLDRWWGSGPRALIVMCNASTAGAEKNDPTVSRCIELVADAGFGGFTVANWEPYIASKPDDLYAWRDQALQHHGPAYRAIRDRNLALIRGLSAVAPIRIIAWGALVPDVPLTTMVLQAAALDRVHDLYAFGRTLSGAPKHPMARGKHRIPNGAKPIIWRARKQEAA